MLNKIIEILNKHLINYAIIPSNDGTSSIVFFMPYQPYLIDNKEYLFLDAYYEASNKVYYLTKEIVQELNESGIVAEIEKRHILKELAISGGLGKRTATTLIASSVYGTRIVLSAITINGTYSLIKEDNQADLCINCNKCVRTCPTGALEDKQFNINRCIRHLQDKAADCSDELAELFGNKLWGCDECQTACPINNNVGVKLMNEELKGLIKTEKFINMAMAGNKALKPLIPYIGYNYLRMGKLLSLALNAAANQQNDDCVEQAIKLKDNSDPRIRLNSNRLISKYNKRHFK